MTARRYDRLGASAPAAATNTVAYTVPATPKAALVSTILYCNRSSTATKVRIATTTGGAPGNADWIAYDVNLPGNVQREITAGITLSAGMKVYVYDLNGTASFSVFGAELG